jgi:hypothetical protein
MSFKLSPPIEKTFTLDKTDEKYETSGTFVTIKQASQGEHKKRSDIYANLLTRFSKKDDDTVEVVQRFSPPELQALEVRITMTDCNIMGEDDKPLFKFAKDGKGRSYVEDVVAFQHAWDSLPIDVCTEIHDKVLEVNPTWGSLGEIS